MKPIWQSICLYVILDVGNLFKVSFRDPWRCHFTEEKRTWKYIIWNSLAIVGGLQGLKRAAWGKFSVLISKVLWCSSTMISRLGSFSCLFSLRYISLGFICVSFPWGINFLDVWHDEPKGYFVLRYLDVTFSLIGCALWFY